MSMLEEKEAGIMFGTEDGNMEIMTLTSEFKQERDLTGVINKLMDKERNITQT